MQGDILSSTLTNKIYSKRSMRIAVFLGGPMVVGYLMSANFKQLGEGHKVGKTWLWSIVGFLLWLVLAVITPAEVPGILFALINFAIADYIIMKYQGDQIKAHVDAGGLTYQTSRAVVVAGVSLLILVVIVFGFFFITDALAYTE